jgi:hypothetical protein
MENDPKQELESRVLGHILSKEEMDLVAGGDGDGIVTLPPVRTTPRTDVVAPSPGPSQA